MHSIFLVLGLLRCTAYLTGVGNAQPGQLFAKERMSESHLFLLPSAQ